MWFPRDLRLADNPALVEAVDEAGAGARPTRTTALLDLATEVPPVVLADLLGMYPNTAVRWVQAAGGEWANYAAIRARQAR